MRTFDVTVPAEAWESNGYEDPGARLLATLSVNGCLLHLEAIAVEIVDGVQRAVEGDEELGLVHLGVGASGRWETVTIRGRDYVLIATPFC